MRGAAVGVGLLAVAVGAGLAVRRLSAPSVVEATYSRPAVEAPAPCPWRDPGRDLVALFPGMSGAKTSEEPLILSPIRVPILKRLGPGGALEENSLRVFRVEAGGERRGSVLVRRAPGEFGAVELVLGVDAAGRVTGVRVQRHREPPAIAAALTAPAWLAAFRGKTAASDFRVGGGVPAVPAPARRSADALARAVRSLLIELDEGEVHARRAARTKPRP